MFFLCKNVIRFKKEICKVIKIQFFMFLFVTKWLFWRLTGQMLRTMNDNKEFIDMLLQNKRIIYKICFMYARDNDDINDLYQDVVLSLWKSFRNFKGHSSVSTWIYRITLNTCITNLRKKKNYDYVPLKQDIDILDTCWRN